MKRNTESSVKSPAMGSFSKNPAEVLVMNAGVVARKNAANNPAFLPNISLPMKYITTTANAPKAAGHSMAKCRKFMFKPIVVRSV